MKKHLFLLLLSAMALLLQGCKTKHCPGYPQDDTDYLPVDFVGQTLRYVYDGDTIAFKVAPPEFSEKYDEIFYHDQFCSAYARMHLESPDLKELLRYEMDFHPEGNTHILTIRLYTNYDKSENVGVLNTYNSTDSRQGNVLPQWISPTGQTYTDVLTAVWYNTTQTEADKDTLYLHRSYGLLHWYIHGGHTLTLLP